MKITTFAFMLMCGAFISTNAQTVIRQQFGTMTAAKLASIPKFAVAAGAKYPLPTSVDNTKQKFMPPTLTWGIDGWSCANAAAIAYCYTYEQQYAQGLTSSGNDPLYDYEYTYHFLDNANEAEGGDGWMFVEAFDIAKKTGIPTVADFSGPPITNEAFNKIQGWMSGYPKYYSAMKLRANEYYQIDASVAANDTLIKHYLYDHGNGSSAGGLLTFQMNSDNIDGSNMSTVSGRSVINSLDNQGGHALVIAGYDDSFNGGSFELVNSWGDDGSPGCPTCVFWAKYSLLASGGGLTPGQGTPTMLINVRKDYAPQLAFKVSITESQRNKIVIMTGVANSTTATAPTQTIDYQGAFNYAGGAEPMAGIGQTSTLEIGLDLTDLTPYLSATGGRFFLQIISKGGTGQVNSLALEDYTGVTVNETVSTQSNVTIPGSGTTLVSVPWTGSVTAINEGRDAAAILSRQDCSASPNPASLGEPVQINFTGQNATSAKLRISDVNGRMVYVRSMPLNTANQFSFSFPWQMESSQGGRITRGLYYASVELRNSHGTVKLMTTKIRVI